MEPSKLYVRNNGPEIAETNYWDTGLAENGMFYVSQNAGAFRLLVPPAQVAAIIEMQTAEYVIVTRGTWYRAQDRPRKDALEILFEDNSSAPYCIHIVREQYDYVIAEGDEGRTNFRLIAYTKGLEIALDLPARYRRTKRLPYLKAWE